MSYLVDITVVGYVPESALQHIAAFEYENNGIIYKTPLGRIEGREAPGNKVYTTAIYGGSYNYLPISDFLTHLAELDWPLPESAVVIIKGENALIIWTAEGWDAEPDPYDMRGRTVHLVGDRINEP